MSAFRSPPALLEALPPPFATGFFSQCPGPFKDLTACYVASFSTMLLNTDQHNPNVRTKMSVEQFVKNNKGINGGDDLPRPYLEGLTLLLH